MKTVIHSPRSLFLPDCPPPSDEFKPHFAPVADEALAADEIVVTGLVLCKSLHVSSVFRNYCAIKTRAKGPGPTN